MEPSVNFNSLIEKNREQITIALPIVITALIVILSLVFILVPANRKNSEFKNKIKEKKEFLKNAEEAVKDLENIKKEITALEAKSIEYEKKLPSEIRASLLFETLKEVTEESQIKFVSIEPQKTKKIELEGSENIYLELPIKIKLHCGYYELIDFLYQVEHSERLMKVTDLSISSDSKDYWEHGVEIFISTYASVQKPGEKPTNE